MALSERSRTTIYQQLEPLLGQEAVGEMLSYFPARDVEEPASREFVRAEIADVRAEISGLRADMHACFRTHTLWFAGALAASTATNIGVLGLMLR